MANAQDIIDRLSKEDYAALDAWLGRLPPEIHTTLTETAARERRIRSYLQGDLHAAYIVDPKHGETVLLNSNGAVVTRVHEDGYDPWIEDPDPQGNEVEA